MRGDSNEPTYMHISLAASAFHELTGRHALNSDDQAAVMKVAARFQKEMGPVLRGFAPINHLNGNIGIESASAMRGSVLRRLDRQYAQVEGGWRKYFRVRPIFFFQEKP